MDDRIAKSEEDVRRLAPIPGAYWIRRPGCEFNSNWRISEMEIDDEDGRLWDTAYGSCAGINVDSELVGWEIVGPIPELA